MKICTICKINQSYDNYCRNKNKKDGFDPQCKLCTFKRNIQKIYNISYSDYLNLLEAQNYQCPICLKILIIKGNQNCRPNIDHNHITNETRGLLCERCNQAIGLFREDLLIIDNAINYLNKFGSYSIEKK